MAADGTRIIKTYDRLRGERGNFDERWERMAPYIAPSRVGIRTEQAPGAKQTTGVYDSTTMMAAELLAMFIAGHIINPGQQWLGYSLPDASDDEREWLEECTTLTLKRAAASMFYAEAPESLIDYGGFGTGFLLGEETPQPTNRTLRGFRGFSFLAEKTGRFIIQDGVDGLVDTAYREFRMSARNAVDRWGAERMPEKITRCITEGKPDTQFKFVHAIYPRPRAEQGYGGAGMPWASCWVEYDTKTLVHESGYRTFPIAVPRYQRTPGEVYGRGRGDIAFPDTWTLNTAKRMGLEDWALKIKPPVLQRHDSVIGSLKLVPGGGTSVNTHGQRIQDVIMPYETGTNPEISNLKEEELRKSIRQIFYVEQILAMLQVEKSEMTAYEFAQKIALLFRILGPVYGRLEWEWLYRNAENMWEIQVEAHAFPPAPPETARRKGADVLVEFHNPISKAQKSGDAEALILAINDMAPMAQQHPEMFDWIDTDEAAPGLLVNRGVPARWTRSKKQVDDIRAAKAAQEQQDLQLQRASQVAEIAGKSAPALKVLQGGAAGAVGRPAPV